MKHKLILFWISSIFMVLCAHAQNNSTFLLKGEVKDSISGNGVPYATLRIMTPGKGKAKAVAVGTTDTNGKFNLKVTRPGAYRLQVVNLGMAPLERDIELKDTRQLNLGTLLMQEYSSTLGTATVTAQRPIVKAEIDKLSYSISEDPDAETNSLLDMLRKVPMVTVDGEDNIQVNGSGSFKVPLIPIILHYIRKYLGVNPERYSPKYNIPKIAPRPVFIIHGRYDNLVPAAQAKMLFKKAGEPKEIWLVPGAKHNKCAEVGGFEYKQRLADFFRQYL